MGKRHMASCGAVGGSGHRIGTLYAYTPEECWEIMGKPWFRFRNDEERMKFFAWQSSLATPSDKEGGE